MAKFWTFIKNASTETTPESVELRIEGDIIDTEDAWIYEWFGIPCASPNAFRAELSQYAGKDITVWINSYGGSVFAAAGMYNALIDHKKTGAKITTKSDAKVMSAATIPYMAGDERLMGPMDIFMMHNPLTVASGYASDLRKVADVLDVVKETIINAYQLATGLSRAKISSMMDEETYMNAKNAIKHGFATGALYASNAEEPVEPVNFAFNRLSIVNSANETMKRLSAMEKILKEKAAIEPEDSGKKQNSNQNKEGDEPMEFKTVEELRNACPDLVKQIEDTAREEGKQAGATAERTRIQDIEKISKNIDPALVNKAKFEEPMDAKDLAFQALQNDGNKGQKYLANVVTDTTNSGAAAVTATPVVQRTAEEEKEAENKAVDMISAGGNKRRGK